MLFEGWEPHPFQSQQKEGQDVKSSVSKILKHREGDTVKSTASPHPALACLTADLVKGLCWETEGPSPLSTRGQLPQLTG